MRKQSGIWKNISREALALFATKWRAGMLSQSWEQKMHTRRRKPEITNN
jgi:hypothetical protein